MYNCVGIPYCSGDRYRTHHRAVFGVAPFLDERGRGLVAAAEAFAAGYGGIAAVAMATGIAPSTIGRGLKELAWDEPSQRIRLAGRRTQTDDFQRPHAAPRSQGAGRADDTR